MLVYVCFVFVVEINMVAIVIVKYKKNLFLYVLLAAGLGAAAYIGSIIPTPFSEKRSK